MEVSSVLGVPRETSLRSIWSPAESPGPWQGRSSVEG